MQRKQTALMLDFPEIPQTYCITLEMFIDHDM